MFATISEDEQKVLQALTAHYFVSSQRQEQLSALLLKSPKSVLVCIPYGFIPQPRLLHVEVDFRFIVDAIYRCKYSG